jgi:hypothetical protein
VIIGVRDVPKRRGQVIDTSAAACGLVNILCARKLAFEDVDAGVGERTGPLIGTNERADGVPSCSERAGEVLACEARGAGDQYFHEASLLKSAATSTG